MRNQGFVSTFAQLTYWAISLLKTLRVSNKTNSHGFVQLIENAARFQQVNKEEALITLRVINALFNFFRNNFKIYYDAANNL